MIMMIDKGMLLRVVAPMALVGLAGPVLAQAPVEGPVATTATITVESKHGAELDPAALKLQINRHPVRISSVIQGAKGSAQVAILFDDGLRGSFGNQISEIKKM